MKTVLITGANRGIGFETARQLGKLGFYIFLAARIREEGEKALVELNKLGIEGLFIQMNLLSVASIKNAHESVREKTKTLDVIINNAGILLKSDNDIIDFDTNDVINTFQSNLFGPMSVVSIFNPLLKPGSRVINVSSGGGSMTDPVEGWAPVYCVSKTALNMLTRQQAYFLSDKGVSVNSVCPGWVRTKMGGRGATRSLEKGAETIVWLASEAPVKLTGRFFRDKKVIDW